MTGEDARTATPRRCLITGATGGLGRALAAVFCQAGFHTIVSGRDADALRILEHELQAIGHATAIAADLAEPADVRRLGGEIGRVTDRLDVVVAGAGQAVDHSFLEPTQPLERWRDMILANVFGTAAVARTTLPFLVASRGSLVLVGSVTGRTVIPGDLYAVTKHAVTVMAEAIRTEVDAAGVHVCLVQPGLMDTPLVSASRRSRPMIDPRLVAEEILRLATTELRFQVNELVIRPRAHENGGEHGA